MLYSYQYLSNDLVRLYFTNNTYRDVFLTQDYGKIIERSKKVGFTTVTHTGIVLGICTSTDKKIIIHNHPDVGYAHLTTLSEFAKNKRVVYQAGECINPPNIVIAKGLNAAINKVKYRPATSNCQVLTNGACNNNPSSPDVKWFMNAAFAVGALLFVFK